MKHKYLYWLMIIIFTILPIILDNIADKLDRHYPFIWSIFLIPSILIMNMYPNWRVVIGSGIFYSFLKFTVEFSQNSKFNSSDEIALILGSFVNWSLLLIIGYFRLENYELLQKVEKMTLIDSLTGLYNRRYFDLFIEKAISLSKRTNDPLLLVMLDIDYFKRVNDTYNHLCGDQALKHIAEILKSNVRESDALIRIGGEEFSIIMLETSFELGKTMAENIREVIEKTEFIYKDERVYLTISLGLSIYKGGKVDEFIESTDKALYRAKENGRNQLVVWS